MVNSHTMALGWNPLGILNALTESQGSSLREQVQHSIDADLSRGKRQPAQQNGCPAKWLAISEPFCYRLTPVPFS